MKAAPPAKLSNAPLQRPVAPNSQRALRREIKKVMARQGFELHDKRFCLPKETLEKQMEKRRETLRKIHQTAKQERIAKRRQFILDKRGFIRKNMVASDKLDVAKISPRLCLVKAGSKEETLFQWWNYVWWSLPYERAYGRQMRYVVWDDYHNAAIGLIGLQSPILSWKPRDEHLGIGVEERNYWVNQSMNIQRLGALPPYNLVLGGKLVALLAASDKVRKDFGKKYRGRETEMQKNKLPPRLLFATTTGAFGKSSIYNRLKDHEGRPLTRHIGYSSGTGSFHIPDALYERMLDFMGQFGINVARGYGNGPSRKSRLIDQAMTMLGYKEGNSHGIARAIYLTEYVSNMEKLVEGKQVRPKWHKRPEASLTECWKERWATPERMKGRKERLLSFDADDFVENSPDC